MTEQQVYLIDRTSDCNVLPNAFDKVVRLSMHHFHARSIIINVKTGDVLTQLFSDGAQQSALSAFYALPVYQFQHSVFFDQEGDKIAFILKTNYNSPELSSYLSYLSLNGVAFIKEIVADVESCSDFEKFRFGEMPVYFDLDLTDFTTVAVTCCDDEAISQELGVDLTVGVESSTLPDMKALVAEYYQLEGIGKLITWADIRLPEQLEKNGIVLSELTSMTGYNKDTLVDTLERMYPFGDHMLYKEKNIGQVITTLKLIHDAGLSPSLVSSLCGKAASSVSGYINHADLKEADMDYLVDHAKELITLSFSALADVVDVEENKESSFSCYVVIKAMLRGFRRELRVFDEEVLYDEVEGLLKLVERELDVLSGEVSCAS